MSKQEAWGRIGRELDMEGRKGEKSGPGDEMSKQEAWGRIGRALDKEGRKAGREINRGLEMGCLDRRRGAESGER